MTARKPLVNIAGQVQALGAGDTLVDGSGTPYGTGSGSVTNVSSSSGDLTVTTPTTTPVLTVVSAPKWTTGRTITLTGDATGVSGAFDGSGNLSFATVGVQAAKWSTARTLSYTGNVTGTNTVDGSGNVATALTIGAGQVTEAMQVLANNTTNNVTTGRHGYAPILPNDATKYLDGTGNYTVPAGSGGSGTVTNTGTLTANRLILGNGGVDVTALGSLGTTTTVLHGNAAGAPTFAAVSLTADVTGTLPVANGGTGQTTISAMLDAALGSTQGNVIYRGASVWTVLAPGTAGYLLQTGGAGANPSWVSPSTGGGALVLLEQHTASASASLAFTTAITATYDEYVVEIIDLLPVTDNTNLLFQVSTDGGSTYQNTNYQYTSIESNAAGSSPSNQASSSATSIVVGRVLSNLTSFSLSGTMKLFAPASSRDKVCRFEGVSLKSDLNWWQNSGGGLWTSGTAYNAFRFLMSSGNISVGTIRVYGVAK